MAEEYVLSMNDQLRRDERPVVFRAAVAFPVSEGGYVAFGTPDFPDIDKAKAEASESKDIICFNCQQHGHTAKKCPKPRVKRCKNCDEVGHNVSNCSQPIKCTTCGSHHHTRHDCPESAKPAEGKTKGSRKRDKSDPPDVAAELRFYLHDQHISHLSVHLRFGYHRNDTDTKLTYTNSDLMLYHANTKGIKATLVDVNEKLLETRATVFGVDKDKLAAWIATGQLYMVNLEYCPSSSAKNIGTNFFTFNAVGEFSDQFERVRSFLCQYAVSPRNQESMLIQAIVRSTGEVTYNTSELNTQMLAQARFDPMAKWYEHGLNCQMGMAIAKADRPKYVLPAKAAFFNITEYLTVFYHGITDIHENLDETEKWMHVNVRFAALPFSGRKYIMFIEMRPSLRLTPGDRVKVCVNWYEDQRKHDWIAEVITPLPFATSQDYTSILSRPYISDDNTDEGHFDSIELPKDSVIEVTDQEDTEKVRSMITTMNPVEVSICLQVSTEPTRRQINALRQLQQGYENNVALKDTCKILTANNLRSLKTVDAFAHLVKLDGEEKLQQVINNQCKLHNKEQRQADAELRSLPGGLLLIQGSPGTGKTAWIINNIAVCYSFATDQDPTQIVVLSGSNAPLDDLAVSIYTRLLSIYNSDTTAYKYPVVIREHSVDTEVQAYRKEETGKRQEIIGTRAPAPIRDDIDISKLAVAQMLLKTYERVISRKYSNITDRRVQQLDLSLGTWMLRVAGLHIHDGKPHPIAHPDKKRFGRFREFLTRYGTGQEFSSHDNTKFTDAAADLRDYVHSMADVQLTTLNNYHQSKVYGEMEPHIIFVDEAAKAPEGDAISAFVWNNAPTRIFVGDIFQIKPNSSVGQQEKGQQEKLRPFAKQMNMSFFSRALYAGYKTVWFTTQHRYANGINNLLNHLGYVDLKTHKDVENRYPVQRAKDLLKKTFDIKGSIVFLDLPSGREKSSSVNPSKMNLANIKLAYFIYQHLLLNDWEPKDIGIATPYVAQLQQYISSHHNMVEYLANYDINKALKEKLRSLANEIDKTDIFTFDSVQGMQREVIICDLTITDKVGFLKDPGRLMVALSRCRSMLIIIGNIPQVEKKMDGMAYKNSKIAQLFDYVKSNNFRVSVVGKLEKEWQAQFDTAEDLGDRRIAFVRNENVAANVAFTQAPVKTYVLGNMNKDGEADEQYQEERAQIPRSGDTEMADNTPVEATPWGTAMADNTPAEATPWDTAMADNTPVEATPWGTAMGGDSGDTDGNGW